MLTQFLSNLAFLLCFFCVYLFLPPCSAQRKKLVSTIWMAQRLASLHDSESFWFQEKLPSFNNVLWVTANKLYLNALKVGSVTGYIMVSGTIVGLPHVCGSVAKELSNRWCSNAKFQNNGHQHSTDFCPSAKDDGSPSAQATRIKHPKEVSQSLRRQINRTVNRLRELSVPFLFWFVESNSIDVVAVFLRPKYEYNPLYYV